MKAFTKFALAVIGLALLIGAVSTQAQQPLTGPQILQKVEEKGGMAAPKGNSSATSSSTSSAKIRRRRRMSFGSSGGARRANPISS
jgi:hypothetical protein